MSLRVVTTLSLWSRTWNRATRSGRLGQARAVLAAPHSHGWQLRKSDAPAGTQAEREANEIQGATSAKQY